MIRATELSSASLLTSLTTPLVTLALTLLLIASVAHAQTTSFTYQGRLNDNSLPANGSYDFQFKLFDALAGGTQIGSTNTLNNVSVSSGVFSVTLDFGPGAFPGANRWLETSVRLAGGGAFTLLSPRQAVTATPYAIKSLNAAAADGLSAACTGCVTDEQIAAIAGSKVTGTIPVAGLPSGSGNYIQNTTSQQASSNFNISGNGTLDGNLTLTGGDAITKGNVFVDSTDTNPGAINPGPGLRFGPTFSGEGIASKRTPGGNTLGLDFYTAYVNRLAITNSGNVGIGTSTPSSRLHLLLNTGTNSALASLFEFTGAGAGYVDFVRNSTSNGQSVRTFRIIGGNDFDSFTSFSLGMTSTHPLRLITDNAERLRITETGNIGIGTPTPLSLLHLRRDITSGLGPSLTLFNGGSGAGAANAINFFTYTASIIPAAQITSIDDGNFGNHLTFNTKTPGAANNALAERLRIASNGHIGIGTSTPTEKLHVAGGHIRWENSVLVNAAGGSIELGGTGAIAGSGTPYIDFHFNGLVEDFNARLINAENKVLTVLDSTGRNSALRIGSNDPWTGGETRRIIFGNDSQACGGPCTYIGEENDDDQLAFKTTKLFVFKGPDVIPFSNGSQNLGNSTHRWGAVFAANGTIQTSDARLKQSVTNLSYGLNHVLQLRPVSFQWKDRTDGRTYLGLLAQEVEKVIPEAIEKSTDPDAALGLNYSNLVPVLVKAVQEQQTIIEQREVEMKAMKEENKTLQARLVALEQMMQQFKEQAEKQFKHK